MNDKFSLENQIELDDIINKIQRWKQIFELKTEFYFDGWAIFLREKNVYPRSITIFKSYESETYSIKSFEITLKNYNKEEFIELYFVKNIKNKDSLLEELKAVIYGKDLGKDAIKLFNNTFSS
jgi:hypothetical protein